MGEGRRGEDRHRCPHTPRVCICHMCTPTPHVHTHPTRAHTPHVRTPHCAHAPHMCIPPDMWVVDGAGVLSPLAQVRESGDPLLVKSFTVLSLKLSSFFSHLAHCDSHLPPRNLAPEKPDSLTCCDPRSFGTQVSGPPSGIFRPNYRYMSPWEQGPHLSGH